MTLPVRTGRGAAIIDNVCTGHTTHLSLRPCGASAMQQGFITPPPPPPPPSLHSGQGSILRPLLYCTRTSFVQQFCIIFWIHSGICLLLSLRYARCMTFDSSDWLAGQMHPATTCGRSTTSDKSSRMQRMHRHRPPQLAPTSMELRPLDPRVPPPTMEPSPHSQTGQDPPPLRLHPSHPQRGPVQRATACRCTQMTRGNMMVLALATAAATLPAGIVGRREGCSMMAVRWNPALGMGLAHPQTALSGSRTGQGPHRAHLAWRPGRLRMHLPPFNLQQSPQAHHPLRLAHLAQQHSALGTALQRGMAAQQAQLMQQQQHGARAEGA